MQTPWNQYTLPLQRPRLHSEPRPFTAYASSNSPFVNEAQEQQQQHHHHHHHHHQHQQHEDEEDQQEEESPYQHIRPALVQLGVLPEAAGECKLSRDDTANDISGLIPPADHDPHKYMLDFTSFNLAHDDRTPTSPDDNRLHNLRPRQRKPSYSFRSLHSQNTVESSSSGSTNHSTVSLGRRFSRGYKERVENIKENVVNYRMGKTRRQSTPHGIDAGTKQILPVQPTSPSKRNGKHGSDMPVKLNRHFPKSTSELRKDTPAPSSFGIGKPGPRQTAGQHSLLNPSGGERARQAAAALKSGQLHEPWSSKEDLNARRSRVGSLSSAADSGADLSSCPGSSASEKDCDGDVEMADSKPEKPKLSDPMDVLPAEISLQIFRHLDAQDLLTAELVSKTWNDHCHDTSVWRQAYLRSYERRVHTDPPSIQVGGLGCGRPGKPDQDWKRMYKARLALDKNWRAGPKEAGKAVYLSGHTDSVYCVQFDEEKIITGSRDRTIRVWDINNYQCLRVIGGPNTKPTSGPKVLRTVDYPDFHIATASVNGTPYGESIYHTPSQWHDASILCLQYDDQILVTGSSDSDLLVWDIKTYEPIKRLRRHTGGVLDVALDGKHIVSCSKDSRIIVWDRDNYEPKGELTGHRGPVNAVQLRGRYLVSASGDGIARLWDIEDMKLVKEFSAKERGLAAVEFSEDMKHVLAGGNDTITYKFEVETGHEVAQFRGHTQLVRSLWLDSQNSRVVSGSYDLDLRVYDFVTGEEIWRAEEWTTSWMLAAKSDYRRIVATSQDGRILIIDFGLQKCRMEDDGQPIPGVDLLRGLDHTSAIEWRDPWDMFRKKEAEREAWEEAQAQMQMQAGMGF